MRKYLAMLGVVALFTGACTEADPPDTTAPSSTSAAPGSSSAAPATSTTTTLIAPTTSFIAPTITYDPTVARYGGQVVIGDDQEAPTLNPYAPDGDNFIVSLIGQAHLTGVYDIDPATLQLIPEAVTELPTVGNGGVVLNGDGTMDVTWNLLPEARWSDGEPISGDDLAFTLEFRAQSLESCTFAFDPDPLPDLTVVDVGDKSMTARFAAPSLQHELLLPWIVPAHAVRGTDPCQDWNTQMWPAGGPFEIAAWLRDETPRRLVLVRNENYWKTDAAGNQLPYLDSVEFQFIPEVQQLLSAFSNRRVDVVNPPPFFPELPIAGWAQAGAETQLLPGPVWEHINFQFGPNNRNADSMNNILEYRQAIAFGLDRRALLDDAGYPWLEVSEGFVSHSTRTASSDPWSQYSYDPDRARALLATACDLAGRDCQADPPRLVYSSTSNADFRPALAQQIAEQLSQIGIQVELQLEDSQLFFGSTLNEGSWDVGNWAWVGLPGAATLAGLLRVFVPNEPPPDGDNVYRWGSPGSVTEADDAAIQVQQLIEAMRDSADADRVFALARQIEDILADQVVIIPINARLVVGVVWADEIQGFQMNPSQSGHTWNIEYWYRVAE